jgi:WD40 repeat protein/serine/threonine protein kinase
MTDELDGKTIRGYELQKQLGQGGFGAVYQAYQPLLKRDVAIKVILPKYANEPDFIHRFETEAELIARLEHPFIVPLYDFWRDPTGAYLVMRLVRGGSLTGILKARKLTPQEIANILDQIAAALHVAHRENVIHRDIKPDNILVDEDMNAYLSDFGIAKSTDVPESEQEDEDNSLTGSLHYIPPEQIQGAAVTPQTDVYALGMVLYEMLSGEHPFEGDSLSQVIMKHLSEPMPNIGDVIPEYEDYDFVIQRATAKSPLDRYETTLEMAKDFRSYLSGDNFGMFNEFDLYIPEDIDIPNPYLGLQAFQESDSANFYGRTDLINQLLSRLNNSSDGNRFLAVIGPSGSGKSSVVKAGLIPALRNGGLSSSTNWFITETTPHSNPFSELSDALLSVAVNPVNELESKLRAENGIHDMLQQLLPDDDSELVLIIDQFEELFTLVEDEKERALYLDNLVKSFTASDSRIRVIITIRADYYDKPLQYRTFGEIFRNRMETVLPLSHEELRESIVQPAESVGVYFDPGLVDVIISDVDQQPGMLPLLQYALTELFENRVGFSLQLDSYQNIGGVTGALARRANDLFESQDESGKEAIRELFMRLVNIGETDLTRRRIRRSELQDHDIVDHVISIYGKSRLLTFDRDPQTREGTIEVAHEAIIRNWDNVRNWIEANREILQIQRRLTASATEWQQADTDPAFLATGVRLVQFESLLDSQAVLNNLERDYIKVSVDHREEARRIEEARKEHELQLQRRSARLLRYIVAIMIVGLVITVGLSIFALGEQRNAEQQAIIADRRAETSRSLALAANAEQWDERNQGLALALAIEANNIVDPPAYARDVLDRLAYQPGIEHVLEGHRERVFFTDFSPDGTMAVSTSGDTSARVWWVSTGEERYWLREHKDAVWSAVFTPDSRYMATGSADTTIYIWDLTTGEPVHHLTGHTDRVRDLAISPDGKILASAGQDGDARLWSMETGELLHVLKGHTEEVFTVDFHPSGNMVATGSFDDTIRIWDVETGETIYELTDHTDDLRDVTFSPDGSVLASAAADSTAKLWDTKSGQLLHTLIGHSDKSWVMVAEFTPDGHKLATGSSDATARLWDVNTGELLNIFVGHADRVERLTFSPAGDQLLTSSWDATARLWSMQTGETIHSFEGHMDTIRSIAFSPDGEFFITGSLDHTARIWDVRSPDQLGTYVGHDDAILSLDYHAGQNLLATSSVDRTIRIWDATSGMQLARFSGEDENDTWIRSVYFNNDGTLLLSSSEDKTAAIWDIETGVKTKIFTGHTGWLIDSAWSSDNTKIATASTDNLSIDFTARIWDVESGETLHILEGHQKGVTSVVFSPDDSRVLTGSEDDTAILWDANTGEPIYQFIGHEDDVLSVAFSPDGKLIATASADATIKLWDAQTGELLDTILGHTGDVRAVVFSDDGTRLLTGSEDFTVRLWDVNTREVIHTYAGHSGEVTDVVFLPDKGTIASVSWDATIRTWDQQLPQNLVEWTYENWDIPEIPCVQRELYGLDEDDCQQGTVNASVTPLALNQE